MTLTVVGGGLCGLIVATQLLWTNKNGQGRVHIIEPAGDTNGRQRDRPSQWLSRLGSADDWNFRCVANDRLAGRQLPCPRGRGLGGSGRINAMIWFDPRPPDFETLNAAGIPTGRLRQSLAIAERIINPRPPRWLSDVARAAIGSDGDGFEIRAYPRLNQNGRRWTAEQLIDPQDRADGRFARTDAVVERLQVHGGRVTGLELWGGDRLPVDGPVVLSAGSLATPAILMRSGLDVPGVGDNLHDHLTMPVVFQTRIDHSPRGTAAAASRFENGGTGPLTCNLAECGGLSDDGRFQLHITPTDYLRYPAAGSGLSVAVNATDPQSRGRVDLVDDRLRIDPAYLDRRQDADALLEGIRRVRRWVGRSKLMNLIKHETIPGVRKVDDAAIGKSIARYAQTLYHPGGTCRLGGPVDASYRFTDVENLFVVDASLLPRPTTGNPTAVLAMLAVDAASVLSRASPGGTMPSAIPPYR